MILCPGDACLILSNCLRYDPQARARPFPTQHYDPPPYDFARQSCAQFLPMTTSPKPRHRYDLRPSRPNHPLMLRRLTVGEPLPIASSSDLRAFLLPIRDQGQEGSCAAFATRAHREFAHWKATGAPPPQYFSPAFGYWGARTIAGTFPNDSGSSLADEYQSDELYGCPWESDMPYAADPNAVPSPLATSDALAMKLSACVPTPIPVRGQAGLEAIRAQLSAGQIVSIGMYVFEEWEQVGSDGILSMPKPGDLPLGGHGVDYVGHNDASRMLLTRNQYSESWGFGGYGFVPYDYVINGEVFEGWTLAPPAA